MLEYLTMCAKVLEEFNAALAFIRIAYLKSYFSYPNKEATNVRPGAFGGIP